MWGRKDQAEADLTTVDAEPDQTEAGTAAEPREQEQVVTRTTQQPASTRAARSSTIGKSVKFKGEMRCQEDLFIDGEVEGIVNIPKNALMIGENGKVSADINSRSLVLHGKLKGKINVAERIEIKKTGSLDGNLVAHRIVIDDGGVFRGTSSIQAPAPKAQAAGAVPAPKPEAPTPEAPKPATAPAPAAQPAPAAPAPAAQQPQPAAAPQPERMPPAAPAKSPGSS